MRRRFTFMEIIIAVSIFTMIALALFTYSQETTASWRRIMKERNRFSELLALDRAIDGVLSNVVTFNWQDNDGEDVPFLVAEPHSLRCACLHRLKDAEEGALRFVEFLVEDHKLYLVHSDRPFLNWNEVGDRKTVNLLAEDVDSITFRYVDWNDDETADWNTRMFWRDDWENIESERDDVPLAIFLTINWQDGRTESWLRRTLGNGYRERYGKWEAYNEDQP
jgi:type II secretory pathway component PulJ